VTAARIRRVVGCAAGLALLGALVACADDDGTRLPPPAAPPTSPPTTAAPGATTTAAGGPTTSSPGGAAGGGASVTSAAGTIASIEVRLVNGQPEGGLRRSSVGRGQQVRIVINPDRADEARLDGYGQTVRLEPGRSAALELTASVAGVFELKTQQDPRTILELEVR
jgi:hypothetical protein